MINKVKVALGEDSRLLRFLDFIAFKLGYHSRRRRKFALNYYAGKISMISTWSKKRTENYNFYYDITEKNLIDLCHLMSTIFSEDYKSVLSYANELKMNKGLISFIHKEFADDPKMKDAKIAFARRIGWYVLIRITRPRLVVETGVHQGVGALVITSALMKNIEEGNHGRYLGIDIDPNSGVLFKGEFAEVGDIKIGDSIEILKGLVGPVDLFISDSDHENQYENNEYEAFIPLMQNNSIIISDNSHANSVLADFSLKHNRNYFFFAESPLDHWYPGAGIGFSMAKKSN
jgi:predicted O-methyltransferase YrrM